MSMALSDWSRYFFYKLIKQVLVRITIGKTSRCLQWLYHVRFGICKSVVGTGKHAFRQL